MILLLLTYYFIWGIGCNFDRHLDHYRLNNHGKRMSFQQSLQAWTRPADWKQPGMLRAAKFLHRTKAAFRSTRDADHGSKIHERGIENAGVFVTDQP